MVQAKLGLKDKVSIILPTYNGESRGFLSKSIESVLKQTFLYFELFLIDDGSVDGTKEICKRYLYDKRVRYVYQKNSGVSVARNNGVMQSSGEFICFIDDDDIWEPEKLEKQLKFIEQINDHDLGLCYTALEIIDKYGNRTGIIQSHHSYKNVFTKMLYENLVDCTSSVMIPRKVLKDVGLMRENWSYAEDYDLWLRIAKKYHIYSIDEPLVLYRDHENKLSSKLDEIEGYALKAVLYVIEGESDIDRDLVFNRIYKNRAKYRFSLGNYEKFRKYIKLAYSCGYVELGLKVRFLISYFPMVISFLRLMRRKI
jgi:glycosyltransferase involved in cell wall biosynthesis